MYVIFDEAGQAARADLQPGKPGEKSFALPKDLYTEIMQNPFVLRELTMVRRNGELVVERVTKIPRTNQTMEQMAEGRDGDIVLAIKWFGMAMEYAPHIGRAATHEFNFCVGSVLTPLCDPVRLSHGTIMQMEFILPEDKLPFRADLFKKASVFVARPYINFRYTYYLDF